MTRKLWPWRRSARPAESPSRFRRRWIRRVLLVLGPLVVVLVAGYVYVTGGRFVETEDAYLKADMVSVSPQVSGPIAEVAVHENQHVDQGDVLFRIDDATFRIALAQAEAHLQSAASQIRALKSSYLQKQEELGLAKTNVAYAEREYQRQAELVQRNVASKAKYDDAKHNLDMARQQVEILQEELAGIVADLNGDPDIAVEQHPTYLAAKAQRDQAALDLKHTVVSAPFAGVASNKPQLGDYVTAGTPAMSIVADQGLWIEANFKETELTHVRPGQSATVEVDTYPDRQWPATVESISQATGSEFSLLPPQNATGNWVKIVQRIPVRIALETDGSDPPLRAGMSVTVEIDTGHQRELPHALQTALTWTGFLTEPAQARSGVAR